MFSSAEKILLKYTLWRGVRKENAPAINTTINILTYPLPRNNLPFLRFRGFGYSKCCRSLGACRNENNDIDERHMHEYISSLFKNYVPSLTHFFFFLHFRITVCGEIQFWHELSFCSR